MHQTRLRSPGQEGWSSPKPRPRCCGCLGEASHPHSPLPTCLHPAETPSRAVVGASEEPLCWDF